MADINETVNDSILASDPMQRFEGGVFVNNYQVYMAGKLEDGISTTETFSFSQFIFLMDQLSISDIFKNQQTFYNYVSDTIVAEDEILASKVVSLFVLDSLNAEETNQTTAEFLLSLADNVGVSTYFNTYVENANGELETEKTLDCWVVNYKNQAFSRYSNYNFNSFAYFNNHYYGANEVGLFQLNGDKDHNNDYIPAKIKTPMIRLGDFQSSGVQVNITQTSNGSIKLKVLTNMGTSGEYTLIDGSDMVSSRRMLIGRGLKGTYFQFELSNDEVSNFDIAEFEVQPIVKTTKVAKPQ